MSKDIDFNINLFVNSIRNDRLIKFEPIYEFVFIDSLGSDFKFKHPVSDYFLEPNDLSLNMIISFKWSRWAYVFAYNLINSLEVFRAENRFKTSLFFDESIQSHQLSKTKEFKNKIFLDSEEIITPQSFKNSMESRYNQNLLFNENTKVCFKVKLNLVEYFVISKQYLPGFIKFSKN